MTKSTTTNTSNVRVGVRIRPLTSSERSLGGNEVVRTNEPQKEVILGENKRKFTYDAVFDGHVQQEQLYNQVAPPLLKSFLDGYNATIMAYGQTGSGKTYTMGSEHGGGISFGFASCDPSAPASSQQRLGLIPRFMSDIFSSLNNKSSSESESESDSSDGCKNPLNEAKSAISASFLEVYGEDVHDLLDEDGNNTCSRANPLPLREDSSGTVSVVGLRTVSVSSAEEALGVLHAGTLQRTTAATLMNHSSSRSHAIFVVTLERTINDNGVDMTTVSRFTFVDLAGSERLKKTGAEGTRAREGIKINEGLLALGNVINALADEERLTKGTKVHVPYRQSKLTRLLQDALGGNSQTFFLACVSPSDTNASETLSTLHYANRARNIKNAPTKNVDAHLLELQRLQVINNILQCELVKERFVALIGSPSSKSSAEQEENDAIGILKEELFQKQEVQDYLNRLYLAAEERQGRSSGNSNFSFELRPPTSNGATLSSFLPPPPPSRSAQVHPFSGPNSQIGSLVGAQNVSTDTAFGDTFEVNPDEDMAILDQLLELQNQDQEFDRAQKHGQEELRIVEGELEEQEALLLQLRESLKVYHSMKEKYELLMTEVQGLEKEKADLAIQLEHATVDPTKGCSVSIKKKLEKVEASLSRARSETRRHQEMYRKAEQEAQKCRSLENKIYHLKQGKAALVRKQKEAAAKHKEFTEAKAREIQALKRKDRKNGKQVTKLEAECRQYKASLERRKEYGQKMAAKLKQTETHLMRLLAMRKRELHDRYKTKNKKNGVYRMSFCRPSISNEEVNTEKAFAEDSSEEVSSIRFLLEKMVSDRVAQADVKMRYESRVEKYGTLMRSMTSEMKMLKKMKVDITNADTDAIRDCEQNVEGLELELELVGSELEDLRSRLPQEDDDKTNSKAEDNETILISKLAAPVIRTLLWGLLDDLTDAQVDRKTLNDTIARKDAALQSFELENEGLNETVARLSKDFDRKKSLLRQSGISDNNVNFVIESDKKIKALNNELDEKRAAHEQITGELHSSRCKLETAEHALATALEKLTLIEASSDSLNVNKRAEQSMTQLQDVWEKLGISADARANVREKIKNSLEDTCEQKLLDATNMLSDMENEISRLRSQLLTIYSELGQPEKSVDVGEEALKDFTISKQLDLLRSNHNWILPVYNSAVERRDAIITDVSKTIEALQPFDMKLPESLKSLLESNTSGIKRRKTRSLSIHQSDAKDKRAKLLGDVSDIVNSLQLNDVLHQNESIVKAAKGTATDSNQLSSQFLDECEEETKKLKLMKSEILVANNILKEKAHSLVDEMNLSSKDVLSLCIQLLKKRSKETPEWWDSKSAQSICSIVTKRQGAVEANASFTKHLELVFESLERIASGRKVLSQALKGEVESAHKALLTAVDGEENASEAIAGFHNALVRLPPLSKEHIRACIDEMHTLVDAAEAMSQSEIEALTLVWEALGTSSHEREQFWGDIEEGIKQIETKIDSPFDAVIQVGSSSELEEWVHSAVREATKAHRLLTLRLFKLGKVHHDVEKKRKMQDTKSQIFSLDSEIRITAAQLKDFEDKAGSKQRLTNKKSTSTNLLKEERFRKQMQSKVSIQLANLGRLLQKWEQLEGTAFDLNKLSDAVRTLLVDYNVVDSWVEDTTAFMHLRTTAIHRKPNDVSVLDSLSNRTAKNLKASSGFSQELSGSISDSSSSNSSRERERLTIPKSPVRYTPSTRSARIELSKSPKRARGSVSKHKDRMALRTASNRPTSSRSSTSQTRERLSRNICRSKSPSPSASHLHIRGSMKEVAPRSLSKPKSPMPSRSKVKCPVDNPSLPKQSVRPTTTPSSFSESSRLELIEATNRSEKVRKPPAKRSTLMPFGNVLSQTPVKMDKENDIP